MKRMDEFASKLKEGDRLMSFDLIVSCRTSISSNDARTLYVPIRWRNVPVFDAALEFCREIIHELLMTACCLNAERVRVSGAFISRRFTHLTERQEGSKSL